MININHFRGYFPNSVQDRSKDILREYLQCLMLGILFDHPIGRRLTFLGGTCLRLVHDSQRFSEDLDFDNDGLTESEFAEIKTLMQYELAKLGFDIEVQIKGKTAYRCVVKYNQMLYKQGLSDQSDQKLVIQIDSQAQDFEFKKEVYILNKYGVFSQILVTPLDIIFSQKCHAILERPRNKGRDFYDVVFLLGSNVKPNYAYLEQKLGITTPKMLQERLLAQWEGLDANEQLNDVQGFLFNAKDEQKVLWFGEVIKQARL